MELKQILNLGDFAQVGVVVRDIHAAKKSYALLFGVEEPEARICGDPTVMKTVLHGEPTPANCLLATFVIRPGVQLDLIQPNEAPSTWNEHLERYGEGIHHIGFYVQDGDTAIARLKEELGAEFEQQGFYGDGSGRYVYLWVPELHCRIELLESFK